MIATYLSSRSCFNQQLLSEHRFVVVSCSRLRNLTLGRRRLRLATASEPHRRRSLYISLLDNNMMSSFMRYCSVRSTTASGWASESRLNSDTSKPPRFASRLRTCPTVSFVIQAAHAGHSQEGEVGSGRLRAQTCPQAAEDQDKSATLLAMLRLRCNNRTFVSKIADFMMIFR